MISGTIFLVYLDISHLPEPGLRVTGVQRERAATILREAAADGRIPFEELEVRMPGTLEAPTSTACWSTWCRMLNYPGW